MNPIRSLLLAASQSDWLRRHATTNPAARRAVSKFMPGERLQDALRAGAELTARGFGLVVTRLGENITEAAEAVEVTRHYLQALQQIGSAGVDCEISVKLTQLGLDIDPELALEKAAELAQRSAEAGRRLWIDMESTAYVDRTLAIYRRLRERHAGVGICLQAYLRRTQADLDSLLPLGPAVRLVKGAYAEPGSLAFADKRDTDESFFRLADRLLAPEARAAGARLTTATHDPALISRIQDLAASRGIPRDGHEFTLLYGIRRETQTRLVSEGYRTRVLISYGSYWYPWYMRRLAERPANLGFVLRSAFSR